MGKCCGKVSVEFIAITGLYSNESFIVRGCDSARHEVLRTRVIFIMYVVESKTEQQHDSFGFASL